MQAWDAVLEDHFEVGPQVGQGGFGTVHRGRRLLDDAPVAIKFCHPEKLVSELPRLFREAEQAAKVEHPSLIRFYGAFEDATRGIAMVYEFVEGVSLRQALKEPRRTSRSLAWIRDLALGVDALHQAGLVHRDLKPENLMLEAGGRIRILDFGLLRSIASGQTVTEEGWILGTPGYLAPEIFFGDRSTAASDRYAVAAIAFEILLHRPLFQVHAKDVVEFQKERTRGCPTRLEAGPWSRPLTKGLALSPEDRPQSCVELFQALARCRLDEGVDPQDIPAGFELRSGSASTTSSAETIPAQRLSRGAPSEGARKVLPRPHSALGLAGVLGLCLALGYFSTKGPSEASGLIPPDSGPRNGSGLDEQLSLLAASFFPRGKGASDLSLESLRRRLYARREISQLYQEFLARPRELKAGLREELFKIDQGFVERGGSPPLRALREFRIDPASTPIPDRLARWTLRPQGERIEGWAGAALKAWGEIEPSSASVPETLDPQEIERRLGLASSSQLGSRERYQLAFALALRDPKLESLDAYLLAVSAWDLYRGWPSESLPPTRSLVPRESTPRAAWAGAALRIEQALVLRRERRIPEALQVQVPLAKQLEIPLSSPKEASFDRLLEAWVRARARRLTHLAASEGLGLRRRVSDPLEAREALAREVQNLPRYLREAAQPWLEPFPAPPPLGVPSGPLKDLRERLRKLPRSRP